jgi:hypothetical protein
MGCFSCLTITKAATISAADICKLTASVGGYKNLYNLFCGVLLPDDATKSSFLAGTAATLNEAAQTIAIANGAPAGTTTATIAQCAEWGLMGTFGNSLRGQLTQTEGITHQGGSCEQPEMVNAIYELMITQTKVGRAGVTPDLTHFKEFYNNIRAYHLIAVECGTPYGAIILDAGTYVKSSYKPNRPQDGIKEFTSREFAFQFIQKFEPVSLGFPEYDNVETNFQ